MLPRKTFTFQIPRETFSLLFPLNKILSYFPAKTLCSVVESDGKIGDNVKIKYTDTNTNTIKGKDNFGRSDDAV